MEDETMDRSSKEIFHDQVMDHIKTLTTKIEELQTNVASISQRLFDHLESCPHASSEGGANVQLGDTPSRRCRRRSEDHKQACLRKSLQKNIILLVESLPFTESELGDMLISAECLTEDECGDLRRVPSRKDQARNLVRLIKGRSFTVMTHFLNCVNHISPEIAKRIWETYQENLKDLVSQSACTFCSLKHSVDIKLLADHVWSIGAISDSLYDTIVSCDHPNEAHWHQLALECNSTENSQKTLNVIREALEKKGHYKQLVIRLRRVTKLECCCPRPEGVPTVVVHGPPDAFDDDCNGSISPTSSEHLGEFERSPLSDISSNEDLVDVPYNVILNNILSLQSSRDEMLQSARRGLRPFGHVHWGDVPGDNINLTRSRSNSFGKSSTRNKRMYQRRASMFT